MQKTVFWSVNNRLLTYKLWLFTMATDTFSYVIDMPVFCNTLTVKGFTTR